MSILKAPSRPCYDAPVLSSLYSHSMEVFRANLQMLEDQQPPPAQPAQPRLLLPDSAPQPAAPPPAPGPVYAMAAAQTNTISNNNNTLQSLQQLQQLQYPQQPTLLKPYTGPAPVPGAPPCSAISVPAPAQDMTQPSYVYHPLCAAPMSPMPRPLAAPAPAPSPAPVMFSNKLKATPTLISLQSAREHKFMPY